MIFLLRLLPIGKLIGLIALVVLVQIAGVDLITPATDWLTGVLEDVLTDSLL
jgi:hypothetical protein